MWPKSSPYFERDAPTTAAVAWRKSVSTDCRWSSSLSTPGPVVIVGLSRDGRAEITVKGENIAAEFLRQLRVVALQLVQ